MTGGVSKPQDRGNAFSFVLDRVGVLQSSTGRIIRMNKFKDVMPGEFIVPVAQHSSYVRIRIENAAFAI